MTRPMPVEIVRPKRKLSFWLASLLGRLAAYFFDAFLVMVILPGVIGSHPSYWQSVGVVGLAVILFDHKRVMDLWSRSGSEKR